jgi:protein phosphatase 1B
MGAFLDKPKTEKHNEGGEGNGMRYALSSMQGWRVEMEDAHSAVTGLPGLKDWSFFAVFDGHAGAKVSAHCAKQLLQAITENEDFKGNNGTSETPPSIDNVKHGIKTGFLNLDDKMRELPEMLNGEDKSGSTAVCTLVSPKHIFFGNCGDSRAVFVSDGKVNFSTQDHKPINPGEKERIQNAGGSVMIQRVNGSLAVSRALGDFEYKNVLGKGPCEQLVSPEPEVIDLIRDDKEEFIILACDGIWDVMSNEELCDFLRSRMKLTDNLQEICNMVVDTCLYKGSRDNMSIVIITFPGAPAISAEAKKQEAELDARLETKIKEILDQTGTEDCGLPYVMHMLALEDIDGLPPGGGLSAKRSTIEEILNRLNPTQGLHNSEPDDMS